MRWIASAAQAVRKVISAARKRLRKRHGPGGVLYFNDGNDPDFRNPFNHSFHILHIRFFFTILAETSAQTLYH